MNGFQLTFFLGEDQKHENRPLSEWLLNFAKDHGARGATLVAGAEGFDHFGQFHSAGFIEMADRPLAVTLSVDEPSCAALLQALDGEPIDVAYVKVPVEFGRAGVKRS